MLGLVFKVMYLNYEKIYLNMAEGLAWSILLMMIILVFDTMVSYLMKKLSRKLE